MSPAAKTSAPTLEEATPGTTHSGLRVLIVDDSSRARRAMAAYLDTLDGVSVIGEALNGQEAIELVQAREPDVVLMDIQMPVMGGMEATRIVKHRWPQVKVIMLTICQGYEREAQAIGADAFVLKGSPVAGLVSTIREVGTKQRQGI